MPPPKKMDEKIIHFTKIKQHMYLKMWN